MWLTCMIISAQNCCSKCDIMTWREVNRLVRAGSAVTGTRCHRRVSQAASEPVRPRCRCMSCCPQELGACDAGIEPQDTPLRLLSVALHARQASPATAILIAIREL